MTIIFLTITYRERLNGKNNFEYDKSNSEEH